jgi:hypothetical protein
MPKPSLFSRKLWFGLFVAVLAVELFSLVDTVIFKRNLLDPLSLVVIDQTWANPETFGTGVAIILFWLLIHWFVWPVWKKFRK